jgi:hypothetical protein
MLVHSTFVLLLIIFPEIARQNSATSTQVKAKQNQESTGEEDQETHIRCHFATSVPKNTIGRNL